MGRSVEFTFQCQRAEVPQCLFQDILNLTKPRWRLLLSGPSQNNLGCKIENMKWFGVKKNFAMYCALYKTELQGSFTRHMNRLRDIFSSADVSRIFIYYCHITFRLWRINTFPPKFYRWSCIAWKAIRAWLAVNARRVSLHGSQRKVWLEIWF